MESRLCPPRRQAFSPSPTLVLMDVVFLMMSPLFIILCGAGNYVHVSSRSHVAFIWWRDARKTVCGTGWWGVEEGDFKTLSWILKSNVLVPHSGFGFLLTHSIWGIMQHHIFKLVFIIICQKMTAWAFEGKRHQSSYLDGSLSSRRVIFKCIFKLLAHW